MLKQESPRYRFGSENRKDPFAPGSPIGPGVLRCINNFYLKELWN